jgi:hypothetical protein
VIYKLAQEDKSQFERMSYDQYALLEQSTQNIACQVDGPLITIWQESQESFTQIQNLVNTLIANVAAMQQQTEIFARCIDQDMETLRKEVPQSFALSTNAEKTAKGISERKGKEVQGASSAKDVE